MKDDPHRYDDMLLLPHHVSKKHIPMSLENRAAQFSPFSALTGYEARIRSALHERCNRVLLSDEEKEDIGKILGSLKKYDPVSITYFHEDPGTDGSGGMAEGEYLETTGKVLGISSTYKILRIHTEGTYMDIPFDDILEINEQTEEE